MANPIVRDVLGEPFDRSATDRYLVRSVLALADDHRERCPGETCAVSLLPLKMLFQRAGIELSEEEVRRLW